MLFLFNNDSINILFKVGKIFFCKLLEKKLINDVEYNFTELLSHHDEVSAM